ncbi:MAG: glycosyltransferase [Lachnospiraceae bacterium]|nr:glycosyltransferase [Lachnospiraceae bacterium]
MEEKYVDGLVSIIMPSYNSEKWIKESIESVQAQTYDNWELIISDDASTDKTVEIVEKEAETDSRIRVLKSDNNQGAAKARNRALKRAKGRYIAYLDSDDLWVPEKLERQLKYMKKKNYAMCYTSYDIINGDGEFRKTIHIPASITYDGYLKRPVTCSNTIVLDRAVIDDKLMIMPNIRRGQDGATWLQILKTGVVGHGLDETLAKYRRHEGSLSNNKIKAVKRIWYLYRKVEKLPFLYSCRCFISYAINATKKYI